MGPTSQDSVLPWEISQDQLTNNRCITQWIDSFIKIYERDNYNIMKLLALPPIQQLFISHLSYLISSPTSYLIIVHLLSLNYLLIIPSLSPFLFDLYFHLNTQRARGSCNKVDYKLISITNLDCTKQIYQQDHIWKIFPSTFRKNKLNLALQLEEFGKWSQQQIWENRLQRTLHFS